MNEPHIDDLIAVDNEYSDRDFDVKISVPEFNCVCPKTGLPDFGTIHIDYIPDKKIIELKSLKLYMVKYRNVGIFHESVTNRILDDLRLALEPRQITITADFSPRGGIHTEVISSWKK